MSFEVQRQRGREADYARIEHHENIVGVIIRQGEICLSITVEIPHRNITNFPAPGIENALLEGTVAIAREYAGTAG